MARDEAGARRPDPVESLGNPVGTDFVASASAERGKPSR
jgi:hypothetical protein